MVEALLKQLKDKQSEVKDSFVRTPCADMADYNKRVGMYQGLLAAEEELMYLVRDKD